MDENEKRSVQGNYCRESTIDQVDSDNRTVELSFSSKRHTAVGSATKSFAMMKNVSISIDLMMA